MPALCVYKHRLFLNLFRIVLGGAFALAGTFAWFHAAFGQGFALLATFAVAFLLAVLPSVLLRRALRRSGARVIDHHSAPTILAILSKVSERASLKTLPELCRLESVAVQAYAMGRPGHSTIVLSDGVLMALNSKELEAVLAHEVAHIRHLDSLMLGFGESVQRLMTWLYLPLASLVLVDVFLAEGRFLSGDGVLKMNLLVLPLLALFCFRLSGGRREFDADEAAVNFTGDIGSLLSALQKLGRFPKYDGDGGPVNQNMMIDERLLRLLSMGSDSRVKRPPIVLPPASEGELDCLLDIDREVERLLPATSAKG